MLWIVMVSWLARLIFVLLVALSIWSITIILERRTYFKKIKVADSSLKQKIRAGDLKSLASSDHEFAAFYQEISAFKSTEQIERAFDAFTQDKRKEMEKGLPILGTLGSTTPFIGLLGTVLGIIVSFGELSQGSGSTNSVMFSLAEALVLTAMGLVVAIPAVIGFNIFSRKSRAVLTDNSVLKDLYIAYRG